MFPLKFSNLFGALLIFSFALAFIVPPRLLHGRIPDVSLLFVPASRPAKAAAGWLHGKFAHDLTPDQRDAEIVRKENLALKNDVSSLRTQVEELKRIVEDHTRYGDIRALCTPYTVAGADAGGRSTLAIQGSSLGALRDGMAVLYPDGIVGVVLQAGVAGARVQLVTDLGFRVRVGFARFDGPKFVPITKLHTVAEGSGRGAMFIRGLTRDDVKASGLAVGDWVILNEPQWPAYLQGRTLGRITAIGIRQDAPLWAQITIEPPQNLLRLHQVMIVTKTKGE